MAISDILIKQWRKSDIVLLGGSAGSFKLLFGVVKHLLPSLGKTVIIIIHRKRNFFSEIESFLPIAVK